MPKGGARGCMIRGAPRARVVPCRARPRTGRPWAARATAVARPPQRPFGSPARSHPPKV